MLADDGDAGDSEPEWLASDPYLSEVFRAVPAMGAGKRWYDPPYRALHWLAFSDSGRKVFPRLLRSRFIRMGNWLYVFSELERCRAWSRDDPFHNLSVPADEQVAMPGIWVAEFFPPSQASNLKAAIARNNWDESRFRFAAPGETLDSAISEARTGRGWTWLRLGGFRIPNASWFDPEATVRKLPHPFERVEYNLVQIGGGLSVVVGQFILTPSGQYDVDTVWHSQPEPRIVRDGKDRRVLDRLWGSYAITQQSRHSFHRIAREMLAETMPGSFVAADQDQPLFDMLLFKNFDPLVASKFESLRDPLRALGISRGVRRLSSPQLPGLLFQETDTRLLRDLKGKSTWTIWGNVTAASSLDHNNVEKPEHKPPAIASGGDDGIRDVLVRVAISYFLRLKHNELAESRDRARSQHGRFRRKDVIALRRSILTSSLDIVSIRRDLGMWTKGNGKYTSATLLEEREQWFESESDAKREPTDFLDSLAERQTEDVADLVQFDSDYRQILSTASSLGASVYLSRGQKITIAVALISITIALTTFIVSGSWLAAWGWITSLGG